MLKTAPLSVIKFQYFIAYGVVGSLAPFLSLFLKQEQGFGDAQVGYATGASNAAAVLMPLLMTSVADLRQDARRLLAGIFAVSIAALAGLFLARGFWPVVFLLCLHSLAYVAMMPLQDGLNFAVQQQRTAAGQSAVPFHQVRVWGTVGFIVPSVLLFGFLAGGTPLRVILIAAIAFCVLGLLNSLRLPSALAPSASSPGAGGASRVERLPMLAAVRVLRRPPALVLCLSLMLANMAAASYYAFYPLYLTETIGIPAQWVGPIFNIGVVFEIGFMLGFGKMLGKLGFKAFVALGVCCLAVRLATLALYPTAAVAVGTQVVHGMIVVALHVAPALYLNRQAGDEYRTSMQGLLSVLTGASRVAGSIVAGHIAQVSLLQTFGLAAILSFAAVLLLLFGFRDASAAEVE